MSCVQQKLETQPHSQIFLCNLSKMSYFQYSVADGVADAIRTDCDSTQKLAFVLFFVFVLFFFVFFVMLEAFQRGISRTWLSDKPG